MRKNNRITILGSGTSTGVPIVGCQCQVCLSTDSKNKRYRSSILITTANENKILVDTTPDLRSQLLVNKITGIDSVIITHDHADHTHGIDDLRPFSFWKNKTINIYTNQMTIKSLKEKFRYIFDFKSLHGGNKVKGGGIPKLSLKEVTLKKNQSIHQENFYFAELPHSYTNSLSFVHEQFAYVIDCKKIPKDYLNFLKEKKLKFLIIDCAKREPHDTHLHLEQSLEYIRYIAPEKAGLIHMGHEFEHHSLVQELKSRNFDHVFPLFDGQIIEY